MKHAKTFTAIGIASVLLAATVIISCSNDPVSSSGSLSTAYLPQASTSIKPATVAWGGPPGYEPAYVNETTVLMNAIEVKQNPTQQAHADLYEVVYPFDPATGQALIDSWPVMPQCNPCDHLGDGVTPDDFHDHVLDSEPGDPVGREYNALWHVYVVMPNYTESADHNAAVNAELNSLLPAKSEDAVDDMLSTQVDGIPIAVEIDTHFYFICAVVGDGAGTH